MLKVVKSKEIASMIRIYKSREIRNSKEKIRIKKRNKKHLPQSIQWIKIFREISIMTC